MKKLIVFSLVFALVAGAVFAVDLTGGVYGHIDVVKGDSSKEGVNAGGSMDRLRLEGSGELDEGKFGGWIRADAPSLSIDDDFDFTDPDSDLNNLVNIDGFHGIAWWKPIDQFKLSIGGNPDGVWGKEGVTGWMFNQDPYDSGVALNSGIWDEGEYGFFGSRYAFFGGFDAKGALLEIKPMEMLGINVAIPFISNAGKAEDVFKATVAQLDLNFDFGNIAVTFDGGDDQGAIFAYFGGSFDALDLDVGFGFHLKGEDEQDNRPIGLGLGLKYSADAFGIKFRTALSLPSADTQDTGIKFDLLPYFAINDNITAFLNMGLGMTMPKEGDATIGWLVNPYVRIGDKWGPSFYAGLQIWSDGVGDDPAVKWNVPISIMVSF